MPGCWFVLLRFWLRIDGLMVRLRDTRILCRWPGAPQLVRELLHAEGTFEELAAASAPTNAVSDTHAPCLPPKRLALALSACYVPLFLCRTRTERHRQQQTYCKPLHLLDVLSSRQRCWSLISVEGGVEAWLLSVSVTHQNRIL